MNKDFDRSTTAPGLAICDQLCLQCHFESNFTGDCFLWIPCSNSAGGSPFETYGQLVEARFEAQQVVQEIEICLKIDIEDKHEAQLVHLIGKANLICQSLNSLRTKLLDRASV
jgi:hypothetical protein